MREFLFHEPCPRCGSKDNLGVWEDGHKWCFGCGYYVPSTNTIKAVDKFSKEIGEDAESYLSGVHRSSGGVLPRDATSSIYPEPYHWLKQYGVTNEEIIKNHIQYSPGTGMLLFPYYGEEGVLLCWQGRFFPKRNPKVYTEGYPDRHLLLHRFSGTDLRGDPNDSSSTSGMVVVEDAVSAIKVSRHIDATPLLGSHLSLHKALAISRLVTTLYLWLDNDKIKEMVKFKARYTPLFKEIKIIISEKDPKEHSDEEIKEYLNG